MKFREEVFAKIFTYITVILLLGIVVFEAYTIQNERAKRRETEETVKTTQESLQQMIDLNAGLQKEKDILQEFQEEWGPYAAFVESREILYLRDNLFSRPRLIPREALELLYEERAALEEGDEEQPGEKKVQKAEPDQETDDENQPEPPFSFDNPDGEDMFLPLSTGIGEEENCLVYTVAYENDGDGVIGLIYEITFEGLGNAAVKDEDGEIVWNCIAYNTGSGWTGIKKEVTEE